MSPSPESVAVRNPLELIAELYDRQQQEQESRGSASGSRSADQDGYYRRVHQHFSSVLKGRAHTIPRLEDVDTRGSLVRFRCMVQDTGLANEVYVMAVPSTSGGTAGAGCCAYSEGPAGGEVLSHDAYSSQDYSNLRERQVIFATSVPGETPWYAASLRKSPTSSAVSRTSGDIAGETLASEVEARLTLGSSPHRSSSSYVTPPSLKQKYPFPEQAHTGALVKIYPYTLSHADEEADKEGSHLKSTEIVEFVGILDYAHFPSPASLEEEGPAGAADTSESEGRNAVDDQRVKTLHAIYRIQPDEEEQTKAAQVESETWRTARQELLDYLASVLNGDKLAAEWVLLSLYGQVYARRGALALGQLPLNLSLPASAPSTLPSTVLSTLSNLLTHIVSLDFSISELNSSRYAPESKEENLLAGRLQLPEGTAVLVDETRLGEGTLGDKGVRNVQALSTVITDQTLGYVFPFSTFTFETDLRILSISRGKSLLPIECVVPLVGAASPSSASEPSAEQLAQWRSMLSQPSKGKGKEAASTGFTIPSEMSELIQGRFVEARKAKKVTQEDLVLRLTVARLLALSEGKSVLDVETWDRTRELDEARKERVMRLGTRDA